jgi:hypothetical protein
MWNLFNCYLAGRHDYGMWCESGQIFLRCAHCGKRSAGWSVTTKEVPATAAAATSRAPIVATSPAARVVPFPRAAAS